MMKFLRRFKDLSINGFAARWYDRNSRDHRIEEFKNYAKEVAGSVKSESSILEVAPGPGYLAIELAKIGRYKIVGLDISKDFVDIARKNAKQAGVEIEFDQGNVTSMPFSSDMFDFLICTAAFKNFKEPSKALSEMYRVLKPEAEVLIIDMNRNVSDMQLESLTNGMGVKGLEALFMKLIFKHFLRRGAYSKNEFINLVSKTPFGKCDVKEIGVSLHVCLQK